MIRLLTFVLLFATAAYGQTVQLVGGSSTLQGASGGSATLYTPGSTNTFSLGFAGGHFVTGASTSFDSHGWRMTLGDSPVFLSTVSAGVAVNLRGVELSRGDLTLFTGLTGDAYNTPFFQGTRANHFGIGFQYAHKFEYVSLSSVASVNHGVKTFLQGADFQRGSYRLQTSGGLLEDKPFFNISGVGQWRHLTGTLNRQTLIYNGQRTTSNSIGGFVNGGPFNANASVYQSGRTVGMTAGTGVRLSVVSVSGQEFITQANKSFSGTVSEVVSRHFRLSQYVTESGGHVSFSAGGSYTSNRLSISVDQSSYFTANGFKQSLGVTLTFRIRDVTLNASTVMSPDGIMRWESYAGTYIQTGLQTTSHTSNRKIGGYVVSGNVVDAHGEAVSGAAVQIGTEVVYTNDSGQFFTRIKRNESVAVSLLPDEFTTPGHWTAITQPQTVIPGNPAQFTASRQ